MGDFKSRIRKGLHDQLGLFGAEKRERLIGSQRGGGLGRDDCRCTAVGKGLSRTGRVCLKSAP